MPGFLVVKIWLNKLFFLTIFYLRLSFGAIQLQAIEYDVQAVMISLLLKDLAVFEEKTVYGDQLKL